MTSLICERCGNRTSEFEIRAFFGFKEIGRTQVCRACKSRAETDRIFGMSLFAGMKRNQAGVIPPITFSVHSLQVVDRLTESRERLEQVAEDTTLEDTPGNRFRLDYQAIRHTIEVLNAIWPTTMSKVTFLLIQKELERVVEEFDCI